ncbi:MAG: ABC transporter permease [Alphaproteobacteria bacterium]|nr:ABC transporter permease [Alphaproteobacteria bacterium]
MIDDALAQAVSLLASTVRLAVPLVLASLAGLFAERSGVVDIGLEGKMLSGAFAAASVAHLSGSPWAGLAAAIAVSIALAMVHAYACITQRGNQVVAGMAINVLAVGLTVVLAYAWFNEGGNTPALPDPARFKAIVLPLARALADVPVLGRVYAGLVSGHNVIVYMTVALIPVVSFAVFRTRFGLRLRAVGENPHAVDTAGISVAALRYRAMVACGTLCGIAGAYLSIAQGAAFQREMTAGRGFLALAALIFGKWMPVPAVLACLLFAFADAVQGRLQGVSLPGIGVVPVQAIQALPYLLTVLLLAGFVGRAVAPKASGIPYNKEK